MERIRVTRIKDIYELFSFLHHLKTSLHHEQDGQHSVRIIILDSLPVLFFPFLGNNINDGKISQYFNCNRMSTYALLATFYNM
jgi:hypothetical protein